MEKMNFAEWLYEQEKNNDNILAPSLNSQLALLFLINYLLDDNWCIDYSASEGQINAHAVDDILTKYSKRYKKEIKKIRKDIQNGKLSTRGI